MSLLLLFNQPTGGTTPATGYSLSGPSSGTVNQASTAFAVALTPSGGTNTGVVVTPHSTIAGTFSPATVTLSTGNPSATFTFTPTATGTATISTTNNGSLTNPSTLSYQSNSSGGGSGTTTSINAVPSELLIGVGSNWSGQPFTMSGVTTATILRQDVIDATHCYVVISPNGSSGPFYVTDNTPVSPSDPTLMRWLIPAVFVASTPLGLVIVATGGGGLA